MSTVNVPREQLEKWQNTALFWGIDSIGVDIMHVLAKPAEQHQGEPVAWLYRDPDGNARDQLTSARASNEDRGGWLEIPLYTRADPGEVERLRADVETMRRKNNEYWHETETLRAQLAELKEAFNDSQEGLVTRGKMLAERDALLRHIRDTTAGPAHREQIDAALSASAEPSAPVERDERAAFDAWTVRQGRVVGYLGWREDFTIWQAALERKS